MTVNYAVYEWGTLMLAAAVIVVLLLVAYLIHKHEKVRNRVGVNVYDVRRKVLLAMLLEDKELRDDVRQLLRELDER